MYSVNYKSILNSIISEMAIKPSFFVVQKSAFTRNRKLPYEQMMKIILSMQGGSINRELYDYDNSIEVTSSAFVQQRDKISPTAFYYLFRTFNQLCEDSKTYKGYKLLAVDGTDVNIAYNPNSETYIKNNVFGKSILMADRGYGSLNLLETIHRTDNLEYLFRIKNDWLVEVRNLPMQELDTNIVFELRTTQTNEDKIAYKSRKAKYISGKSKFGKYKTPPHGNTNHHLP